MERSIINRAVKTLGIIAFAILAFDTLEFDVTVRKEKYNLIQSVASVASYGIRTFKTVSKLF